MIWDRAVDVDEVNVGIGKNIVVAGVSLFDSKLVASLVHLGFVAAADRGDVRIGMGLVDRDELGTKAQTNHGGVDGTTHLVFLFEWLDRPLTRSAGR